MPPEPAARRPPGDRRSVPGEDLDLTVDVDLDDLKLSVVRHVGRGRAGPSGGRVVAERQGHGSQAPHPGDPREQLRHGQTSPDGGAHDVDVHQSEVQKIDRSTYTTINYYLR